MANFYRWLLKAKKDNFKQNDHESKAQPILILLDQNDCPSSHQQYVYNTYWKKRTKNDTEIENNLQIKTLLDAKNIVSKILHNETFNYRLVPLKEYCKTQQKYTDIYCHFQMFSGKTRYKTLNLPFADWFQKTFAQLEKVSSVISQVMATKSFIGTFVLMKTPTMKVKKQYLSLLLEKKIIIHAAAKAAAIETLPINILQKQTSKTGLAQLLVELGQMYSPSCSLIYRLFFLVEILCNKV